jgi:hypothetical protein
MRKTDMSIIHINYYTHCTDPICGYELANALTHRLYLPEKKESINRQLHNIQFSTYSTFTKNIVAGFPPRRPGFKPGSGHVGFCDGQK